MNLGRKILDPLTGAQQGSAQIGGFRGAVHRALGMGARIGDGFANYPKAAGAALSETIMIGQAGEFSGRGGAQVDRLHPTTCTDFEQICNEKGPKNAKNEAIKRAFNRFNNYANRSLLVA